MRFRATIWQSSGTATGIPVPDEVVEALGSKHPKVTAVVEGFSYRSSVASMGGRFMLPLSAERRKAAGVKAGDKVTVELSLDTDERSLDIPAELAAAFAENPEAKAAFAKLSFSAQQRHVLPLAAAKAAETRARRVAASIAQLTGGS